MSIFSADAYSLGDVISMRFFLLRVTCPHQTKRQPGITGPVCNGTLTGIQRLFFGKIAFFGGFFFGMGTSQLYV